MDPLEQIERELQDVGLSEKEAKVYLASLELGEATAQQIAAKAIVNRPTTYIMIESLAKRGLMSSVIRGKKRFYCAEPPEKIVNYLERKATEVQRAITGAQSTITRIKNNYSTSRPYVRVFEGKEGLKSLISDIKLSKPKKIVEITDADAMENILTYLDLRDFRLQLGRTVKDGFVFYSGNKLATKDPASKYKTFPNIVKKKLPIKFSNFKSNIGIYGNKIALVTFDEQMHSVIIESPYLKKTMEILFELAEVGSKHVED